VVYIYLPLLSWQPIIIQMRVPWLIDQTPSLMILFWSIVFQCMLFNIYRKCILLLSIVIIDVCCVLQRQYYYYFIELFLMCLQLLFLLPLL
jgi:hypothetical protein